MAKINTLNYQTVASWNGSQDLFVVEQPDGTKVATPAQLKQFVLNDMDEVPTQDSDNPVKSGGIFSTMAVPKYDSANMREYYEGGAAFDGNIDSSPTAGSNNAVASGGTKTYVDNSIASQISTSLNNLKIRHKQITLSNVAITSAWGNIFESGNKSLDISDVGISTVYGAFVSVKSTTANFIIGNAAVSNTAVIVNMIRGTSATINSITLSVLVIGV